MVGPSSVAVQGHLIVASQKGFNVMAHPETEWPSQQNILILYFFLFHYFFSSTCRHIFGRTVVRKF